MGCIVSCGFKFVLQTINLTLCLAFLAVGIFGIILKSSKTVVQSLLEKLFDKFKVGDDEIRELAKFIVDNADGFAVILMVVGFILALVCLYGSISVCCGLSILLKIYAAILILLVVVEIVVVAYLFSDQSRIPNLLIKALTEAQQSYGQSSAEGKTSTAVWNLVMTIDGLCCGIDGFKEFPTSPSLPLQCCALYPNSTTTTCTETDAEAKNVPGCREKVENFVYTNAKMALYISIAAIGFQAILIAMVILTICC
nr:tetraspanin [Hymenolepis microstoma]